MKIKFMSKVERLALKQFHQKSTEIVKPPGTALQSKFISNDHVNISIHTEVSQGMHQKDQQNQLKPQNSSDQTFKSDLPIFSDHFMGCHPLSQQNIFSKPSFEDHNEQRERSRNKKDRQNQNNAIHQRQKEFIKNKYLGRIRQEKSSRHNNQYKSTLNFQWDKDQDTSGISPDNLSSTLLSSKFLNKKKDFLEARSEIHLQKSYEQMTERDWRIFREDNQIYIKGGKIEFPFREWNELEGLDETLKANLSKLKFEKPKPIQMQAIPVGMALKDLMAIAPTGEGKTLAYLIPIIQFMLPLDRLNADNMDKGPYAIVLVPSRQLAEQIDVEFSKIAKGINLVCYTAVGGHQIDLQAIDLSKGCDILIGTPGRIKQLLDKHYISLERLSWCVIDQADKMISENLSEEVEYILDRSGSEHVLSHGKTRVTHLFSATMVPEIQKLAATYLSNQSAYITIGEPGGGKKSIHQQVELLDQFNKPDRLGKILKSLPGPIIVFVNQREKCEKLAKKIQQKWARSVGQYHGGKNQEQREKIISQFRNGKFQILIATDLAGRGLDVKGINAVISYDAPKNISEFIHRSGRTGRAGMKGKAFTFLTSEDEAIFYDIRVFMQRNEFELCEGLRNHPSAQVKPGTTANIARRKQIVYTN